MRRSYLALIPLLAVATARAEPEPPAEAAPPAADQAAPAEAAAEPSAHPTRGLTLKQMKEEKRVALVIGNGGYAEGPLPNPPNDAHLMADTLRKLGFEVIEQINANQKDMKVAIRDFADKIQNGGVGVFFYAGHGMQVDGRNYLVPIGAKIAREEDVDIESVDVGLVTAAMDGAKNRLNIIILDACRDNPFARSSRSGVKGLAQPRAAKGTLIAYATAPGQVAEDGESGNSSYTRALSHHMLTPGLEVGSLFKEVRSAVGDATTGRQTPWESSSVTGDFFFVLPDQERPQVQLTELPPDTSGGRKRSPEQPTDTGPQKSSGPGVTPWIIGGVGVVGLGVGVVFGLRAKDAYDEAETACPSPHKNCSGTATDHRDDAELRANISNVGFAVGAVGVAVGAAWLLLSGGDEGGETKTTRSSVPLFQPTVSTRGAGGVLSGRF